MNQEKIGKIIKNIRLKEKLSQQKFAEKFGVTYQAVSKWENGKNIPDIAILKEICKEYNLNLNDLLESKINKKKKRHLLITLGLILIVSFIIILFFIIRKDDFEFKPLSTTCNNFNLYGSIAYNDTKSSIYISNISYCGKDRNKKYKKIECILYENNNKIKTKIGSYIYNKKKLITMEEFLKNVNFKIDNYEKTCKVYKENSIHLEIDATLDNGEITSYKIPLKLEDNC